MTGEVTDLTSIIAGNTIVIITNDILRLSQMSITAIESAQLEDSDAQPLTALMAIKAIEIMLNEICDQLLDMERARLHERNVG